MIERINLVPKQPLSEKIRKAAPILLGGLLSVLGLIFYVQYTMLENDIREFDEKLISIHNRMDHSQKMQVNMQQLAAEIKLHKKEQQELQQKVNRISKIKLKKNFFSRSLAGITMALPPSIRCETISFNGKTGKISGSSVDYKDLPSLVNNLSGNPLFNQVELEDVDRNPQADLEKFTFSIAFELNE